MSASASLPAPACLAGPPVSGRFAHERTPVVATHRAADGLAVEAAGWRVVDGWSAAVKAACEFASAVPAVPAVVVVHFHRPQDFRTLARTVAAVRAAGRCAPAVIVRETGARLRLLQQVALLRLGASLIVARETDLPRLRLAVESFAQLGPVRAAADADGVLREVQADLLGGVCPPALFRQEVERLLAGSGDDLQHALVRLDVAGDVARLAGIGQRRVRDALVCGQGEAVWLFLLGCDAGEIERLLARLFGARFARLFTHRRLYDRPDSIRRALTALAPGDAMLS